MAGRGGSRRDMAVVFEDAQITEVVGADQGPDSHGVADTIAPLGF